MKTKIIKEFHLFSSDKIISGIFEVIKGIKEEEKERKIVKDKQWNSVSQCLLSLVTAFDLDIR